MSQLAHVFIFHRTHRWFTGIFLAAAAVFFAALWLDHVPTRLATKPIPVLALMALLALSGTGRAKWPFFIGFAFSIVGDIALELPDGPFILGLGSFLIAHVAYIIGAWLESRHGGWLWLLGILPWCGLVYGSMYGGMGNLAVPVAVYVSVIALMGWRMGARARLGGLALWGAIGACTFMLSDSLIAFRKFGGEFPGAKEAIMVTYWAGQALIAVSALRAMGPPDEADSPPDLGRGA